MKTIYLASVLLSFFCITSCGDQDNSAEQNGAETYHCPMECEGEKVYHVAGTCPICEMDLVNE